jgi:hypothetical protein
MNLSRLSFVAAGITVAAGVFGLLPASPASAATPRCTTTVVIGSSEAGAGFMTVPWSGSTTRCSLVQGNKNSAVTALQRMMYYCYSEKSLSADGDFGPATFAALKRTQTKIHAGSDGQYGPETASKIDGVGDSGCGKFPAN